MKANGVNMKIRVRYNPPPIPMRQFDWTAIDDNYEPGMPIGYGPTKAAAILDLREQELWYNDAKED